MSAGFPGSDQAAARHRETLPAGCPPDRRGHAGGIEARLTIPTAAASDTANSSASICSPSAHGRPAVRFRSCGVSICDLEHNKTGRLRLDRQNSRSNGDNRCSGSLMDQNEFVRVETGRNESCRLPRKASADYRSLAGESLVPGSSRRTAVVSVLLGGRDRAARAIASIFSFSEARDRTTSSR